MSTMFLAVFAGARQAVFVEVCGREVAVLLRKAGSLKRRPVRAVADHVNRFAAGWATP